MPTQRNLELEGVMPANILPFSEDYKIDEVNLRRFIGYLLSVRGVSGIVCNGHAGEVVALSSQERRQVAQIVADEVADRVPVVAGIHAEFTEEALRLIEDVQEYVQAVLIFPPNSWLMGKAEQAPYIFFETITRKSNLPIVLFQYPRLTNASYSTKVLSELAMMENVVAVKCWSRDIKQYQTDFGVLKSLPRRIFALSACNERLFASFCIGADGAIIGSGSLYPKAAVQLFEAVKQGDLEKARQVNNSIISLTEFFYREPLCNVYTRIKAAHMLLGHLDNPLPRPPLPPLRKEEIEQIHTLLKKSQYFVHELGKKGSTHAPTI